MILDRARLLDRLAAGATVVTPNRRLARDLKRAFDLAQQSSGRRVWPSADVLPWEAWLARCYLELPPADESPQLLSALQEQVLWQQVIADSDVSASLAAVRSDSLAAGAGAAWALLNEHGQAGDLERTAAGDEQRAFAGWVREFARRLRHRGAISAAQLPALLATRGRSRSATAPPLVLASVDPPAPAAARLLEALAESGVAVEAAPCQARPAGADACRVQCADLAQQWRWVAAWARARLQRERDVRIGIVVPDLGAQREPLMAALTDALTPALRLLPDPQAARPFNVSLGQPLADSPLVACALALLDLTDSELEITRIGGLLRSPFLAGGAPGETEWESRARLDRALREAGSWQVSLDALRRAAIGGDAGRRPNRAPGLADALTRIARRRSSSPRRQSMSAWIAHCHGVLADAGFPGTRPLDSVEHQTHERWCALLVEVGALDALLGPVSVGEALARLRRAAAEVLFQPESVDAPVQLLGVLESSQLEFDHLWLANVSDERWPPPAQPDPWLPLALQRRWELPQASAELSLRRARGRLSAWLAAARTVVVSHAELEGDRPVAASPLARGLPVRAAEELAAASEPLAIRLANGVPLAARVDAQAPPIALERAASLRGGTRVFTDQSACAFRAFAAHRLHAQPLPEPRPGLDPMLRGGLLHATLEAFWRDLGSQAALRALGDGALHARLGACVDAALDALAQSRSDLAGPRLRELERERLLRTVHAWLQVEDTRPPFTVLTVEAQGEVALGGLAVKIRPDRVDRLEDGSLAIIDYKTGRVAIADWLDARPTQPQLPLYAVAFDSGQLACGRQRVGVLAYAQLRPGASTLRSLAAANGLVPEARVVGPQEVLIAQAGWDGLLADWRAALVALARSFLAGDAAVAPKSIPTSCEHCALPLLCRIGERLDLAARLAGEAADARAGEVDDD